MQVIVSAMVQLYKRDENYNTNEIANAVLACLVAVTGCCPFIAAHYAILIGGETHVYYSIVTKCASSFNSRVLSSWMHVGVFSWYS